MREHHLWIIVILVVWLAIGNKATACSCAAQNSWQREDRNLLTNFFNLYNPCVVKTTGEYPYKMWFFGWAVDICNPGLPGCDAIYHARSKDLLAWEVYSGTGTWDATMQPTLWVPVITASDRWYDAWHIGDPSVVLHDGRDYMAYSATSHEFAPVPGYAADMVQCTMGAVSDDGIQWTKSAQPLLIHPDDSPAPSPNPTRIGDYCRPCLHREGGKWRLWFDYWVPGQGVCMGLAENTGDFMAPGGFTFTHNLSQPLLVGWPNPEIIKIGSTYYCFADPPGFPIQPGESIWKSRQLREAVSPNGISWTIQDFIPPDADADACHVPQTLVDERDGQAWLYLFYATQVGYKKQDGQYHYQYDNIRAMRRPVTTP